MKNYQPYSNYTSKELERLLIRHSIREKLPEFVRELIRLAFKDNWNAPLEFDGCSVVQDFKHPDIACFIHDWLWITNKGGKFSNKLFHSLMILEGYEFGEANKRKFAVTLAWNFVYRFKKYKKSDISLSDVKKIIPKEFL